MYCLKSGYVFFGANLLNEAILTIKFFSSRFEQFNQKNDVSPEKVFFLHKDFTSV